MLTLGALGWRRVIYWMGDRPVRVKLNISTGLELVNNKAINAFEKHRAIQRHTMLIAYVTVLRVKKSHGLSWKSLRSVCTLTKHACSDAMKYPSTRCFPVRLKTTHVQQLEQVGWFRTMCSNLSNRWKDDRRANGRRCTVVRNRQHVQVRGSCC